MENKNNQINNNQTPKSEENKSTEPLEKSESGWTVEHLMAMCPSLTREEAEKAYKMGW